MSKIMNISSNNTNNSINDIDDDSDTDDMYCRGRVRHTTQNHPGDAPVEWHSRSHYRRPGQRKGKSADEVTKRKIMDINQMLPMSRKVPSAALSSTSATHPIRRSINNRTGTSTTTSDSTGLRSLLFQQQPSFLVSTTTRSTVTMTRAQMIASAFDIVHGTKVTAAPALALAHTSSAPSGAVSTTAGTVAELDQLSPSPSEDRTDNEE
jgi:hypothetical protein